jgi:hypothetical protein
VNLNEIVISYQHRRIVPDFKPELEKWNEIKITMFDPIDLDLFQVYQNVNHATIPLIPIVQVSSIFRCLIKAELIFILALIMQSQDHNNKSKQCQTFRQLMLLALCNRSDSMNISVCKCPEPQRRCCSCQQVMCCWFASTNCTHLELQPIQCTIFPNHND